MITLLPTATPITPLIPDRHPSGPQQDPTTFGWTDESPATQAAAELDGFQAYLQQIGSHEMLDAAEERRLATLVQAGRAADGSFTAVARAARDTLVEHNLKLAVYCANKYARTAEEREDLTSAANHGLMLAAERFLPGKNVRFNTYATWPIYSMIVAELGRRRRVVDLPRNIRETLRLVRRAEATLLQALGRDATDEELALRLDLPAEKVASLRELGQANISLDAPVGDDGELTLGETLRDDEAPGTAKLAARRLDAELIRGHLRLLGERETLIVELRTGLRDGREWTLDEIGDHLNVSRERVRQIEERTHRKLRALVQPAAFGAN